MNEVLNLKYITEYTLADNSIMWRVQVTLNKKERHNLGSYTDLQLAINRRNKFLLEVEGSLDRIADYFKPKGKELTARIIALLNEGKAVKDIAKTLGVSDVTVYRTKNEDIEDSNKNNKVIKKKLLYSNQYFK